MTVHNLLQRARTLAELERYEDAVASLARVLASEPENVEAWCLLAHCHRALNQPTQMLDAANQVVRRAPDLEEGHRLASVALLEMGSPNEATQAAVAAVRLAPNDHRTHVQLALAAGSTPGSANDGYEAGLRARELRPHSADAHFALGFAAQGAGHRRKAIAHYSSALRLHPGHPSAINNLTMLRNRRLLAQQAHDYVSVARQDRSAAYAVQNLGGLADRFALRIFAVGWFLNVAAFAMLAAGGFTPDFSPARAALGAVLLACTVAYVAIELRYLPPGVLTNARLRFARSSNVKLAFAFAALSVITSSMLCFLPFRYLDDFFPIKLLAGVVFWSGIRTYAATRKHRG